MLVLFIPAHINTFVYKERALDGHFVGIHPFCEDVLQITAPPYESLACERLFRYLVLW